jgi:YesN/AraC family two-component response regulator
MEIHEEALKEMKILYMEDDPITAEELGQFLKRRAGRVYIANNGVEGLKLFHEHNPDIIIADLFLPIMGGVEMVKTIREEGFQTPVIITSAVSDSNVILSAVDTGILKYLLKPIHTTELLKELSELAERLTENASQGAHHSFPNKKELESRIKKEFSAMLKSYTGKGPKDVTVFISSGTLEICATEIMTPYEKTLLDNFHNLAIINQNRRLFYQIMETRFSAVIGEILNRDVHLTETDINLKEDRSKLIFRIGV